jgi:hypothetical protein
MSTFSIATRLWAGAFLAGACAAGAAAQPAPQPQPGEVPKGNHYQCYPAKQVERSVPHKAVLSDQFGRKEVVAVAVTRLCNPVDKRAPPNGVGPIVDKTLHLVCYRIEGGQEGKVVRVRNQFGVVTLRTGQAEELCLPSSKIIVPPGK